MCLRKIYFLLLLFPYLLFSQKEDLQFEHLSMKDGLSMNPIMTIVQDNKGFLWFGTQDGLNKYDGYKFKIYKSKESDSTSISDNYITSSCVDQRGRVCVGTLYGLNVYDPKKDEFQRYIRLNDHLQSERILSMHKDIKGYIWLGTEDGVSLFDPYNDKIIPINSRLKNFPDLSHKTILAICQDKEGTYWFGSTSGLIHYLPKEKTYIEYTRSSACNTLTSDSIQSIFTDSNGQVWIGTSRGLNKYNSETNSFTRYFFNVNTNDLSVFCPQTPLQSAIAYSKIKEDNVINNIIEDKEGYLWMATLEMLIVFNPNTGKYTYQKKDIYNPNGLNDYLIKSLFIDHSENLWVGTLGNGLNKVNIKPKKFQHYYKKRNETNCLSSNYVRNMCEDAERNIWVATVFGGLNCFNPNSLEFTNFYNSSDKAFTGISTKSVWAVCYDSAYNCLWIGTDKGLDQLNLETRKISHFSYYNPKNSTSTDHAIRSLFVDSKGNLWCGTESGLGLFKKETSTFRFFTKSNSSISNNTIWKIVEDKNNNLWLATNDGLDSFDPISEVFFVYKKIPHNPNSLSHNSVRSLCIDKEGNLWVGTQNGLNRFNVKTGEIKRYYEEDGLPNPFIYGIVEDARSHLWISTNRGLSEFDKVKTFKNYDLSDGLQDYEFNTNAYLKAKSGEIYFGGQSGLNRFNPNQMKVNTFMPPVVLTEVKINDKTYQETENIADLHELILDHHQNNLSFNFSSLDFTNPSRNKYMCMLEHFNKDWVNIGTFHFISYTNLDPGKYTFLIKGSNSDGVWNQKITVLNITIHPPYWKTWWFYILCGVCTIVLFITYMRFRTRSLVKSKIELEKIVTTRTLQVELQKNELEQKNKDITDSINYAKRIQTAILPSERLFFENFDEAFIFYKPRDIVSGDLYWFTRVKPIENTDKTLRIVAAVDCTGHGVPGAFMSLIASELLNQTIKDKDINTPADILQFLNYRIPLALHKNNTENLSDGMDVAVCSIDLENMLLYYSGANRPLWIINKEGRLKEYKATKISLGDISGSAPAFENHKIELSPGDTIYLFSDGFTDQFGGPNNKKIGTKQLRELLISYTNMPLLRQKQKLSDFFDSWKGSQEQVDDILIIGIRV